MTFEAFAHSVGVLVDRVYADGKIHRCATVGHPRSKNGAYAFDGRRGWAMAWDRGDEVQWYQDPNAKPWTDAEKRAWMARRDADRRERIARQKKAAQQAQEMIRSAKMGEHGYLRLKGFPELRGLVHDETLIVPMRHWRTNTVQGAQTIQWNPESRQWVKKMIYGMRASDATFSIGQARETILCEGFATGLSIDAALKMIHIDARVLVCFSAQNLLRIARQMIGRFFVVADHDRPDRQGRRAGPEVAEATGAPWTMAPTEGQDFNDWHMAEGLMPLCRAIVEMRSQ